MKTKLLLLLTLFAALNIQCSKDSGEPEEIAAPPTAKPDVPEPVGSPDDWYGPAADTTLFYENGYSTISNARLIVDSLAASVAPEFQYVISSLEGSGDYMALSSKISELQLQEDGAVYVGIPRDQFGSLLYVPGWDVPRIYHWDLEYSLIENANRPAEIIIIGTGRGSHIWEISYAAWVKSEITFEFRGIQMEGADDFVGSFTLFETSPEEKYNLQVSGMATLEFSGFGKPD